MPRLLITTCLALALAAAAHASTILNTIQADVDRSPGWSGGLDGMLTGSGGNTEKMIIDAGGRLQWRSETSRVRLQVSGGYEESDRHVTARNLVGHLRHNRELGARWATVAFAQVQSNPFQQLSSRTLLGAGLRHDFRQEGSDNHAILGVTPMLEAERLKHQHKSVTRGRLSTFLMLSWRLSPSARVSASGFWQPLFADLGDARAVGNLGLVVDVTGSVDLKAGAAVQHDSRPPAGVEATDWSTYLGFGIDL